MTETGATIEDLRLIATAVSIALIAAGTYIGNLHGQIEQNCPHPCTNCQARRDEEQRIRDDNLARAQAEQEKRRLENLAYYQARRDALKNARPKRTRDSKDGDSGRDEDGTGTDVP